LKRYGIDSEVVTSKGQFGGGALPGSEIISFAVKLIIIKRHFKKRGQYLQKICIKSCYCRASRYLVFYEKVIFILMC